jgi:hypothetical protein
VTGQHYIRITAEQVHPEVLGYALAPLGARWGHSLWYRLFSCTALNLAFGLKQWLKPCEDSTIVDGEAAGELAALLPKCHLGVSTN